MKPFLALLILNICCGLSYGQKALNDSLKEYLRSKNSIYLEVGGTSVIYSLSYDRIFSSDKKWKLGGRVGISLLKFSFNDSRYISEFYTMKALKNHKNRYLELGIGAIYRTPRSDFDSNKTTDSYAVGISPRIGLRVQKPGPGWLIRIAFTPVISKQEGSAIKILPWVGISIGRSF